MTITDWLRDARLHLLNSFPVSSKRRRIARLANGVEQVERRLVLTDVSAAQANLSATISAINAKLADAGTDANAFFNSISSDVATPLMSGPLAPLTSQAGAMTSSTVGSFQTAVNSNITTAQNALSNTDAWCQSLISTPVGMTLDVSGGTWDFWSYPDGSWWGASYSLVTSNAFVNVSTDSSGWVYLDANRTIQTVSGTNQETSNVFANVTRDYSGVVSGNAGLSKSSTSVVDETFSNFSVDTVFNGDPLSGGDDSLYFSFANRTSDSYLNIGGYGTSGPSGNVLGYATLGAERLTADSSFATLANLSSNGVDTLDSSYYQVFSNGAVSTQIHLGPEGFYTSSGIDFATPNGVLGARVVTTPYGVYGQYTMIAEASTGLFVHSSGTCGPGVANYGGSVSLANIDPSHSILFEGSLQYWEDPTMTDPFISTGIGVQLHVFDGSSLQVQWSTISGSGGFSGRHPSEFWFIGGNVSF